MANRSKISSYFSAPTRRSQRREGSLLWRFLGTSLGVVLGLILYVRWLSLPWSLGVQTNQEVRVLEARLRERRAENIYLIQRRSYLQSAEGIEALARSRGYHRPGEQVYLEANPTLANKSARP